ncbi:hypothetical protein SAY87_008826 [Trapa incisa]|uniref:Uncharacterized protein n=1 Tax=Trapa incisa TaxID=236973 RepID=A0AAN7JYK4_9MYRT|nr:hypothetical protein SAY87_008826 [Trapa incisa]
MAIFKIQAYSKIDKEDPEEAMHRRARFLIHKVMEEADRMVGSRRITSSSSSRPCFLMGMRLSKVKLRIGNRLRGMKRRMLSTISAARGGTLRQLRACRRLFVARLPRALLI